MASETTKSATLALVGKHPGWADFLWLGLDKHPLLERVASALYEAGIVRNLQGSVWGDPREQMASMLERCRHGWLWRSGEHCAVGRLVPSRDTGGRTMPLMAIAQWTGSQPGHVVQLSLPILEALQDRLQETATAADAEEALVLSETALASLAARDPDVAVAEYKADLITAGAEGWAAARAQSVDQAVAAAAPVHLRLPAAHLPVAPLLAKWSEQLAEEVAGRCEFVVFVPADRAWVDVVFGTPSKPEHLAFLLQPDAPQLPEGEPEPESRADRLHKLWRGRRDEGMAIGRLIFANRTLSLTLVAAVLLLIAMVLVLRGCDPAGAEEGETAMASPASEYYLQQQEARRDRGLAPAAVGTPETTRDTDASPGQD
ncbi:MAG: hypothetical protein HN904_00260 [Victivallales bacterium]|nr:hypothetical protein [Victivallales bacterium]